LKEGRIRPSTSITLKKREKRKGEQHLEGAGGGGGHHISGNPNSVKWTTEGQANHAKEKKNSARKQEWGGNLGRERRKENSSTKHQTKS